MSITSAAISMNTTGMTLAHACFEALVRVHDHWKTRRNPALKNQELCHIRNEARQIGAVPCYGHDVAQAFAAAAANGLDRNQFAFLLHFLGKLDHVIHHEAQEIFRNEFLDFKVKEMSLSGLDDTTLVEPSGPPDAALGIVLHCQTKRGDLGSFWDLENDTINALQLKGFDQNSAFGFDWHWRGEESLKGRGSCPAGRWNPSVKKLHDEWSARTLQLLALPILVVAGKCARESYEKTLGNNATFFEVEILGVPSLTFVLDFTETELRRLACFITHPAFIYFNGSAAGHVSVQLDAALNFCMWLTGQPHDPASFQKLHFHPNSKRPMKAPLGKINTLIAHERAFKTLLPMSAWDVDIIRLARKILDEPPEELLQKGTSPLVLLKATIGRRSAEGRAKAKAFAGSASEQKRGKERRPNGSKCLHCSEKRLHGCDGQQPCNKCVRKGRADTCIYRSSHGFTEALKLSSPVSNAQILEKSLITHTRNVSMGDKSHATAEEISDIAQDSLTATMHLMKHPVQSRLPKQHWHGQHVHFDGRFVRLYFTDKPTLSFEVKNKDTIARLTEYRSKLRIHFTPSGISLKYGAKVLYQKPRIEFTRYKRQGEQWNIHFDEELARILEPIYVIPNASVAT